LSNNPLRVGICAFAQEVGVQRPHRSVPALALAPLREIAGVEWFSLMPDRRLEWMVGLSSQCGQRACDWLDTCEVIEQLDLVISVDTAVAHLAASLEVPTWILLPMRSDWKWGTGETSVWYPDAKLFRQKHPVLWDGVISEVCDELAKVTLEGQRATAEIG
jgi:hypothetical protein